MARRALLPLPSGKGRGEGHAAWRRTSRAAAATAQTLLDLLLPPYCLTCDQPVGAQGQFCPACFRSTTFIAAPCCDACGLPFAAAGPPAGKGAAARCCESCTIQPPIWGQGRAALLYNDQARRLLLAFKYADRPEISRALAPIMARAGAALLDRADLIVPVPLHRRRLLARRYNQAALLAQSLSRLAGRPAVLDALCRTRTTIPLGNLSPTARQAALTGAIDVNPKHRVRIIDARILLIDDVLTTGATAEACTRALLAAGAGGVDVLAAARVPNGTPD